MSKPQFAAGMLAWRRALKARCPEVTAAVMAEWTKWLRLQRIEPPDVSKPLLTVVVYLSCIDDLDGEVGLAQMLALPEVRRAVVLVFPTAAAAKLARGKIRRSGWEGLIKTIDQGGCDTLIWRLPGDTPLLLFPAPAILGRELIENQLALRHYWELKSPLSDTAEQTRAVIAGRAYFGRAKDYFAWRDQQAEFDWPRLINALDPGCEALELGISPTPQMPAKRAAWPDAVRPLRSKAANGHALAIPLVATGDELIVRTSQEPFHSNVIERLPARLLTEGKALGVRASGSMLGPAPRLVRIEAHRPDGDIWGDKALVHIKPSRLEPWMLSCFLNRGGGGNAVVRAFAGAIGSRLAYAEDEPEELQDIPVVWGVLRDSDRILAQAKAKSMYFFYIDHAYFDRGHRRSYRITRNRYEAGAIRRCPEDRIRELGVETRPWRKSGKEIIVCPPTDYFMQAHGCADWLETTLAQLKAATDRPIVIREKPKDGETAVPLPQVLRSAHALVTHSSNVAIESVCLGTPVFVADTSAAAPVGRTDLSQIEDPIYPDRDGWLAHLAYNQFSFDEIRDGTAWKLLLELEERELA